MDDREAKPKAFSVYCDCYQHVKLLSMQERGELFTALFEYAVNGITTDFDNGQLTMAFSFLRAQMERDFTKYRNVCERNRQNANKKKQINQPFPVASSGSQYKEKDKNKEKDKEKNKRVDSLSADADAQPRFDYQAVVDSYHAACVSLPKVQKLSDNRRRAIRSAHRLLDGMTFDDLFAKVEQSDFLTGRSGSWKGCGFDWILKQSNLLKIIEGNYDNKQADVLHDRQRNYEEVF